MKKILIFFMLGAVAFAFKININPWTMRMGEVSMSLGYPTIGIRYGIIDNAEVGFSMKELGGYFKLGFSSDHYAISAGLSSFSFVNAMFFGSAGIHFENIWTSVEADYREQESFSSDTVKPNFSVSGEIFIQTMEKGNMSGGLGAFLQYKKMDAEYFGGAYASSTFEKVWFIDRVDMLGGVAIRYNSDEQFRLMKNLSVVFDISVNFYLFRR